MQENVKSKGEYTIYSLDKTIKEDSPVIQQLRDISRGVIKDGQKIIKDLKTGKIVKRIDYHTNLTPYSGLSVFTGRLAGITTYTGIINYFALGSGNTAFSTASVKLNTEVFRKLISSASSGDNLAYIDLFIDASDVADQTFKEIGAFIDGSASVDSGQAFSLAVQDIVKSGSIFISLKITLSQ